MSGDGAAGEHGATVLRLEGVSKSFAGLVALKDVSFDVADGAIAGLIGPNGAGKTTAFNVITRLYAPDRGAIAFDGDDLLRVPPHRIVERGIARTFQNVALFRGMTTLDNIMTGRLLRMHGPATRALGNGALGTLLRPLAAGIDFVFDLAFWGPAQKEEIRHREVVEKIIDFLEIQAIRKVPVGRLPYGLQKRVELGRALAMEPHLLLLDEPMAGMGPEESQRMIDFLRTLKGGQTIVLVEHDMDAVFALADRISVMVYGRIIASGAPEEIRGNAEVREAYLGEDAG